jgi:hypothetical protein
LQIAFFTQLAFEVGARSLAWVQWYYNENRLISKELRSYARFSDCGGTKCELATVHSGFSMWSAKPNVSTLSSFSGGTMSNIHIDDLSKELDVSAMSEVRGGIWDYSNRLGYLGQQLEDRRDKSTSIGGNGPSIEDGASAGDDSSFYPGLTPLR